MLVNIIIYTKYTQFNGLRIIITILAGNKKNIVLKNKNKITASSYTDERIPW